MEEFLKRFIKELHDKKDWFNKEELENTPGRINRFYREWEGNQDFKFTVFPNPGYDQMVVLKDISFYSMCSHHLLPFYGRAHVGYLPGEKICGISKLARVVRKFASKPQVQERMTQEIVDFLWEKLEPRFVMTVVEGKHLCMLMRGVREHDSMMVTSALKYGNDVDWKGLKEEFLRLIR